MPKLPKRLPYELVIAAALALGSCDSGPRSEFSKAQRAEIVDLAQDATHDALNDDEKFADLTRRLEAVEQRLKIEE